MKLPEQLLQAASQLEGGRIVLVIGAGSSAEPPTSLPLSKDLSLETHRKLVEDGVLSRGECPNPGDLSSLAETVLARTKSQQAMVSRFPCDKFRQAQPNEGHLLAAALLYEQVLYCVVTLNFDLALSNALAQIGTQGKVIEISGPEDHARIGLANIVYLHRNVNADPDKWVLRSTTSDENWTTVWERVVAEKMISAPVTVFVGLGVPVGVIEHSAILIINKLDGLVKVFQVDPMEKENSALFKKLGLGSDSYLQMTWTQFMREISKRLVEEHRAEIQRACDQLIKQEGWDDPGVTSLCARLAGLGLIELGKIRARWTLKPDAYLPRRDVGSIYIADLLLAVGIIEKQSGSQAILNSEGVAEFRKGNSVIGTILFAHGLGTVHWTAMEAKLKQSPQYSKYNYGRSVIAVISGVNGGKPVNISPPPNIVYQANPSSLIPGNEGIRMITVDEIRAHPDLLTEVLS